MDTSAGPRPGDAFGQLLLAQHRDLGSSQFELVERDDGFIGATDARTYFSPPAQWGPLETQACLEAQGRVLDVGCGAGRHSTVMIERGLDVVGLEPSAGAAEVARAQGVPVIEERLDQVPAGDFNTILMLGNNLSLLASPETASSTLTRLAEVAAPGAVLLGQTMSHSATQNPVHLAYQARNVRRGRLPGQLRIRVRFQDLATEWFDYWFLTRDELAKVVGPTPWSLVDMTTSGPAQLAKLRL